MSHHLHDITREPAAAAASGEAPADAALGALPAAGDGASVADATGEAGGEAARERDEYRDLLLRKTAEFDNYRKRIERERREQAELAAADLIADLLPLVDNLDRALGAAPGGDDPYRKGVELIRQQLVDTLARRGVVVIDPAGEAFDPHWHEAVLREPGAGAGEGTVLEVFTRGYRIGTRLLRAAQVKVASA
jgi:molecular chaperone GrpE